MLVLTRHIEQSIRIGRDVQIKVVRLTANQVRLGITAPPDVEIVRTELDARDSAAPEPPAAA